MSAFGGKADIDRRCTNGGHQRPNLLMHKEGWSLRSEHPHNSETEEGLDRGRAKEPRGGAQGARRTAYGATAPNMFIAIRSNPSAAISFAALGDFNFAWLVVIEPPHQNGVVVPARVAYSRSASLGSR